MPFIFIIYSILSEELSKCELHNVTQCEKNKLSQMLWQKLTWTTGMGREGGVEKGPAVSGVCWFGDVTLLGQA
jgi:hypothetical protein